MVSPINNNRDGTVSILHDLCCIEHPYGAFCTKSNYPIDETINTFGKTDDSCACIMEWRSKAAWNCFRGHAWTHTYSNAAASSDLTPCLDVVCQSYLPISWSTYYLSNKSDWDLEEVEATAQLCAPAGTHLNCPSEDNNCKIPCLGTLCVACATGCSNRHCKRWNDNGGRDHANAGASNYCCSGGQFKELYWQVNGTQYGTCA